MAFAGKGGIMAVIRKRKGRLLLSAGAGALGMGIICFGLFFACTQKLGIAPKELFKAEDKLEQAVLVRLTGKVLEGEVLSASNMEEIQIQAPEGAVRGPGMRAYEGKVLKLSMDKHSILSQQMVYEGEAPGDDERLLNLSYVKLSEKMKAGDYVDVRISFRNGGDYVLLSRKKIQDISGNTAAGEEGGEYNALWLQVNEEEILRLASAVVDSFYQEGCEIYAIQYVSELQKAAAVTYPVNETVRKLLESDPNVAMLAEGNLPEGTRRELRAAMEQASE